MNNLAHKRCFNHAAREAAARCPECGQFFCRECVTDHADKVLCAACLKKSVKLPLRKRRYLASARLSVLCALGLFTAWFFFFLVAETLARLPESFHEGTIWQAPEVEQK
jgi:hypothetical protein